MLGGSGNGISLFGLPRIRETKARREFVAKISTTSSGDPDYRNYPSDWDLINYGAIGAAPAAYGDGTYVDGTITGGIGLSGTPQNPVTISSDGYVLNNTSAYGGDAIYGSAAAAWSILNLGTIEGNPTLEFANGIRLEAGGSITNGQSGSTGGSISGNADAVRIDGAIGTVNNFGTIAGTGTYGIGVQLSGGTVSNSLDALISGSVGGVSMAGAAASTVSNLGTIAGTGTPGTGSAFSTGIYIYGAGAIINGAADAASALISGSYTGIRITGSFAATVANFGTIAGGASGAAIRLFSGGGVSNAAGALISGAGDGIVVSYTGAVSNFGTIRGTGTYSTGIGLAGGGSVANAAGGLVAGGYTGVSMSYADASTVGNDGTILGGRLGVGIFGGAATVSNFGTIEATGSYARGVYLSSGGRVDNLAGGLIAGALIGVDMSGVAAGTVSNFGTIAGTGVGAYGIHLSGGHVGNALGAVISGRERGIGMAGAAASTVSNLGTIAGTDTPTTGSGYSTGIYIGGAGTVFNGAANAKSALISGAYAGIRITGDYAATVANFGTIRAIGTIGGGVNLSGGSVSNAQGALISGANGVYIRQDGSGAVSNLGTIRATAASGSGIAVGGGGNVANAAGALVVGGYAGIRMDGVVASTVSNYGTIIANHDGITILGTAAAVVTNFGTIAAFDTYSRGIYLAGTGTVVNGAADASSALIAGLARGVHIEDDDATVSNFGTIAGTGAAATGIVLSGGGNVSNALSGRILAAQLGLVITGAVASTVSNLGTIAGTSPVTSLYATGIYINGAATVINGAADAASALISAGFSGIRITGNNAATVTNYGTILGTGASSEGIELYGGGSVRNLENALISGGWVGVFSSTATVANYGTIRGTDDFSSGIRLRGGGSVDNALSGLISGGYVGVSMYYGFAAMAVTNFGTIAGGRGISIYSTTATVDNFGTVAGSGGDGIYMKAGAVANGAATAASALIAGLNGVVIAGTAAATVSNFGTIASIGAYGAGIVLSGGGNVGNAPGALIWSSHLGVIMAGAAGTVANLGTIAAAGGSDLYPIGIVISGDGTVINGAADAASALIAAAHVGIQIAGSDAATVANYGTIFGTGTSGTGIHLSGGGVDNAPGALIAGMRDGVVILDIGAVSNFGAISGGVDGIQMYGPAGLVANFATIAGITGAGIGMRGGAVVNGATDATSALVAGVSYGIAIHSSTAATVTNFGTIEATGSYGRGVYLGGGGRVSNIESALISGAWIGIKMSGEVASTVSNYGTISGDNGVVMYGAVGLVTNFATVVGLAEQGIEMRGGAVVNGATDATSALVVGRVAGVSISGAGGSTVSNFGTIEATGTYGRGVYLNGGGWVGNTVDGLISGAFAGVTMGGAVAGTVTNYGRISGGVDGVQMYGGAGFVANFATIVGLASIGIDMSAGAVVNGATDATSALIGGVGVGVAIGGSAATVSNFGTIRATGLYSRGIYLSGGGAVRNALTGLISGVDIGIQISGTSGTATNYGRVVATQNGGIGIRVDIGAVTNFTGGVVLGGENGIGVYVGNGNVISFGTIAAAGPFGTAVVVQQGTFINYGLVQGAIYGLELTPAAGSGGGNVNVSGTVIGATGISTESPVNTSQTVTVAGTVVGTGGTAVSLTPFGSDRLILGPGAAFQGAVDGGGGTSVLQVSAAPSGLRADLAAIIAYVGLYNIVNFSTLQIDPSAVADASGVLSFDTLVNEGQIIVAAGDALSFGTVLGAANTGTVSLRTGGSVRFLGAVGNQTVDFDPAGGLAVIDHPEAFGAAIIGFEAGDTIDLALGSATNPHYAGGVLTLSYGGAVVALTVFTPYARPVFVLSADGQGGTDIAVTPFAPPRDFDGSSTSDILWRDSAGNVAIWLQAGMTTLSSTVIGFADASWSLNGSGDFDGDGMADLLWRNADGNVAIWNTNGISVTATGFAGFADPAGWTIAATGDFDGDGKSDILWREAGGNVAIWQMNGTAALSSSVIGFADASWQIAGAGDLDGDGRSDILWRNLGGDVAAWLVNGTSVAGTVGLGFADPAVWRLRGTGDFDGNGRADILWQDTTGNVAVWLSDNAAITATAIVGVADPAFWSIRGIGDYNGDGKSDILWRETGGNAAIWELNGTSVAATGAAGFADPASWNIVPPDNTGLTTAALAAAPASSTGFGFADISDAAAPAVAPAASIYDAMPQTAGASPWLPQAATMPIACTV